MTSIPSSAFLDEAPEGDFDIIQFENNQIVSGSLTRQVSNEGIVINCSPTLGNITSPNVIKNNEFSIFKNFVNKEISIIQKLENKKDLLCQKNVQIKTAHFNDSKKINSILNILNDQNEKSTKIITDFDIPFKEDQKFDKKYSSFDENIRLPNLIEILNNFEEAIFLPEDNNDRQNYIYQISYPLNYNNSINLNEGVGIEPFSLFNPIQFKTKQEFEFNRFWANIDNSLDTRNNSLQQKDFMNIDEEHVAPCLENSSRSLYFVKGNSLKGFVSTQSYVFLDQKNKISPFHEKDINEDYKNKNYNDSSFKKIFKDLKLYESIVNREENVFFKENDKFTSCGFDYSYTNSLGKNSIAFKGLE